MSDQSPPVPATERALDAALATIRRLERRLAEARAEVARLRAENDELRKLPRLVPVDETEDDDW